MPAWLDKPLRSHGRGQDGKGAIGGGRSLQSLLQMSYGAARSMRGGGSMRDMIGVL
jgi:hypothetical protein